MLQLESSILLLSGFNSTETKIRTPDGKIWKEEEFHNLSREIYRDLSRQFAGKHRTQSFSSHGYPSLFVEFSDMTTVSQFFFCLFVVFLTFICKENSWIG